MPADLEITIRVEGTHGQRRLTFELHSSLEVVPFYHRRILGQPFSGEPEALHARLIHQIEKLSDGSDEDGHLLLQREVRERLDAIGQNLYYELFSSEMRQAYRRFRDPAVESLLITSNDPWIPWEIIKPYDDSDPQDVVDDEFLCERFQLTRWLQEGERPGAAEIRVRKWVFVEASRAPSAAALPAIARERKALHGWLDRYPALENGSPSRATLPEVKQALGQGGVGMVHVAAHGDGSKILLADGGALRAEDLEGRVKTLIKQDRPLVFLNTCRAASLHRSWTAIGGWARRWVERCGCGAFIGPMWQVGDTLASEFARAFYHALEGGATFGDAARKARLEVRALAPGRPTWLAFCIYADPNGRLLLKGADQAGLSGAARPTSRRDTARRDAARRDTGRRDAGRQMRRYLATALAWYQPAGEDFRAICDSVGFPTWPFTLELTSLDRWQEVVDFCARRNLLSALESRACVRMSSTWEDLAAWRRQRSFSGGRDRASVAVRLDAAIPRDLLKALPGADLQAVDVLGAWALDRELTVSATPTIRPDALRDLFRGSRFASILRESRLRDWIRECSKFVDDGLIMALASRLLARTSTHSPGAGRAAVRWMLETLDQMTPRRLDLFPWWLGWWPDAILEVEQWIERTLAQDHRAARDAPPATLNRLYICDRLLIESGVQRARRAGDPPSVRWAYRTGRTRQVAGLLEGLGETRQEIYLRHFHKAGSVRAQRTLGRSLRRLAERQGGYEALPVGPWGLALRCCLSSVTEEDLKHMLARPRALRLWLSLLPLNLTERQLNCLVEVFKQRTGRLGKNLAAAAGRRLAAHPEPGDVWRRLSGGPWAETWLNELAVSELHRRPLEQMLKRLADDGGAGRVAPAVCNRLRASATDATRSED